MSSIISIEPAEEVSHAKKSRGDSDEETTNVPTIVVDDLTVTPASHSFPTNDDAPAPSESINAEEPIDVELDLMPPASSPTPRPSQLMDELKYLLKSTNSLATPGESIQESQEADATGQRRSTDQQLDLNDDPERLLIEGLTPGEVRSLGAAERRSIASRGHRASSAASLAGGPRAQSMQPNMQMRSNSQSSSSAALNSGQPRSLVDHLSGLFWAFLAAYAFSTILFLTKLFGVDLLFGFFVQMVVQTAAFAIYVFYKNYHLLGPLEQRGLLIARALFMSLGTLTSFLAFYYISLADLSAVRQSQVVLTIVLSIFFLHERVTILRIVGFVLTLLGLVVLFRPIHFGTGSPTVVNLTDSSPTWLPNLSSWNHVLGITLALFTALMFSIASIIARLHTPIERLHNSVLCFWSSLFGLILSLLLMALSFFFVRDTRFVPHDWRLLVSVGLALASIFVFIANQKAIKRVQPSIVTLIYASDIIFALILQSLFTQIRSDLVLILGCLLILVSIGIICIEVFIAEKHKKMVAMKVAQVVKNSSQADDHPARAMQKRLSL